MKSRRLWLFLFVTVIEEWTVVIEFDWRARDIHQLIWHFLIASQCKL